MDIPREVSTQLDVNMEAHHSMIIHAVFLHNAEGERLRDSGRIELRGKEFKFRKIHHFYQIISSSCSIVYVIIICEC